MTRLASYAQFPLSHLLLSRSELPPSDPRLPVSAHHHTALDILPPSEMSSVSSYSLAEFFVCSLGPGLNVTFFFFPLEKSFLTPACGVDFYGLPQHPMVN